MPHTQQTKPYAEYNLCHNITIRSYCNVCFGTFHQWQNSQARQATHRFEKHQVQHERVFPRNSDWISHQLAFQYVVTETNMIVNWTLQTSIKRQSAFEEDVFSLLLTKYEIRHSPSLWSSLGPWKLDPELLTVRSSPKDWRHQQLASMCFWVFSFNCVCGKRFGSFLIVFRNTFMPGITYLPTSTKKLGTIKIDIYSCISFL